ncbi:MAG TPA: hypothetical protein VEI83_11600 [Acidimicrobiales bacterium]|nr:hypothetical protein [Acidimicrobiales bacterium]
MDTTVQERGVVEAGRRARPEVLLEAPESAETAAIWDILEDAGYRVSWCPGPEGASPVWCPLLGGNRCALVESADAVVCALPADGPCYGNVLAGLGRLHPETPVVVQAHARSGAWHRLHGPSAARRAGSAAELVECVEASLHFTR